ncbi:MAG TPA: peptidoglycan-associated lipoprotein Pal [Gallionella sp.]|nr:peptidoglycan-associated lipoprotein Pal [Gallionella sp.]
MKKLVISLVLVNLLAACASNKPAETTAATADSGTKATAAAKTAAATTTQVADDRLNDPTSILAKRSVYYPFDVDAVQDADKPVVQAHGQYLGANPNRKVRLEGNCDERGSNEYNLGLGQRRADGVKKMLELSGAKSVQLDSVSYGEEKPRASGHDEASWAQNRRTDINYAK